MFYLFTQILGYILLAYFIVGMIHPEWVFPPKIFGYVGTRNMGEATRFDVLYGTVICLAGIFCIVGIGTLLNIYQAKNELERRVITGQITQLKSSSKQELVSEVDKLITAELLAAKIPACGEHVANDIKPLHVLSADISKLPEDFDDPLTKASYLAMIADMHKKLAEVEGCAP